MVMEDTTNNEVPVVPERNKGGRPKKTQEQRAIESGDLAKVSKETLDQRMLTRLLRAQEVAIDGLEESFNNCPCPQKRTAAMINLRELMDDVRGGKTVDKSKEIGNIIKTMDGKTLSHEQILAIGGRGRSRAEIATIISSGNEKKK
jgi:hypothetical protein